jgi:hypothetical protein
MTMPTQKPNTLGSFAWSCVGAVAALGLLMSAPTLAADTINGQVLVGKAPLADSTITLWASRRWRANTVGSNSNRL